jgi:hypothetical protein
MSSNIWVKKSKKIFKLLKLDKNVFTILKIILDKIK